MFKIIKKEYYQQEELIYKTDTKELIATPTITSDITFSFIYLFLGFNSENMESTQFWCLLNLIKVLLLLQIMILMGEIVFALTMLTIGKRIMMSNQVGLKSALKF